MKTAQQWFAEYAESHQNPTNKAIHWLAVPVIYATVFGLLWSVPMPFSGLAASEINWAMLIAVPVLVFYFSLSFALGAGMTLFTALVFSGLRWHELALGWPLWLSSLLLFVVMWLLQFIGHHIEGKKPSFFQDIFFLLIGPAWLLSFILQRLGIRYQRRCD
ncbi:DUF962 domain-containing protein [Alkalimonas amylolytica]|uniref:Uncharacterized membrane protein YGL010W n=1 Tax=Alkalimonas amylolytica TaxID=152573 RepID=A0A1H3Z5V0_ALKAM|nr:Mpo1-like protein [Alkalimonas amylolytica]SEA19223.1 Uncharacterized membrane protein YGL010W [Alkalimonas amylolytica]